MLDQLILGCLIQFLYVVGAGHGEGECSAVVSRCHGIAVANIRSTIREQAMQQIVVRFNQCQHLFTGNCNSSQHVNGHGLYRCQNDYLVRAASTRLWSELRIKDEKEDNMDSEGFDEQVPEIAIAANHRKDEEFLRQFKGMEASRDQKIWASSQACIARYPDQVLSDTAADDNKIESVLDVVCQVVSAGENGQLAFLRLEVVCLTFAALEHLEILENQDGSSSGERNGMADQLSKEAAEQSLAYGTWKISIFSPEGSYSYYHRPFHEVDAPQPSLEG